jgi:hypothetical protein
MAELQAVQYFGLHSNCKESCESVLDLGDNKDGSVKVTAAESAIHLHGESISIRVIKVCLPRIQALKAIHHTPIVTSCIAGDERKTQDCIEFEDTLVGKPAEPTSGQLVVECKSGLCLNHCDGIGMNEVEIRIEDEGEKK